MKAESGVNAAIFILCVSIILAGVSLALQTALFIYFVPFAFIGLMICAIIVGTGDL